MSSGMGVALEDESTKKRRVEESAKEDLLYASYPTTNLPPDVCGVRNACRARMASLKHLAEMLGRPIKVDGSIVAYGRHEYSGQHTKPIVPGHVTQCMLSRFSIFGRSSKPSDWRLVRRFEKCWDP